MTFRCGSKRRWPLLVIAASEFTLQSADVLVVSRYMTPTDVAIYFAAAKTMSLIMFVHYAVGSAVGNRFAALGARGDKESLDKFARDAAHWTFWPSLAAAVIILILGVPLLWLFGPQFVDGYPVMLILVVGFLFRSVDGAGGVPAQHARQAVAVRRRAGHAWRCSASRSTSSSCRTTA